MTMSNFRSLIRTMLRQAAQSYDEHEGINIPEITQTVVNQLTYRNLTIDERIDALYAIVYDEAKDLFKNPNPHHPLQLDFLRNLKVPEQHALLLVQINEQALQVPCDDGKNRVKPLFGKERMTRDELALAKDLVRRKGNETLAKADLLDRLFELPGYYQ